MAAVRGENGDADPAKAGVKYVCTVSGRIHPILHHLRRRGLTDSNVLSRLSVNDSGLLQSGEATAAVRSFVRKFGYDLTSADTCRLFEPVIHDEKR